MPPGNPEDYSRLTYAADSFSQLITDDTGDPETNGHAPASFVSVRQVSPLLKKNVQANDTGHDAAYTLLQQASATRASHIDTVSVTQLRAKETELYEVKQSFPLTFPYLYIRIPS